MMQKSKFRLSICIVFVLLLVIIAGIGIYDYVIPEQISLFVSDVNQDIELKIPFISLSPKEEISPQTSLQHDYNESLQCTQSDAKFLGIIPIKSVDMNVYEDIKLYPGGMPFGVKFFTHGVLVVGISEIDTEVGNKNPAFDAGLRIKDVITKMNGKEVNTVDEVSRIIEESNGQTLNITFLRNNIEQNIQLSPMYSVTDKKYKTGIWIRNSTAGIGTVTFINPKNSAFAGLGHGICDIDTGELMPLMRGTVVDVTISGINKGKVGSPGELKGYFNPGKTGSLIGNTEAGVFGIFAKLPSCIPDEPLSIALKKDIVEGAAYIYTTTDSNTIEKYDIEISRINKSNSDVKNFIVRITDPRLLECTGGIVQGMSGSPIIQNGKIVGAVTHVLINDPTKGYGIFIENMIKNMPDILQ